MTTSENILPSSTPEGVGIASTKIMDFINAVEHAGLELHSLMLLRQGAVVAQGWWQPYSAERPHMLFSLSKSFTSSAVGLAVEEGLLALDDRVISFFPEDLPETVSEPLAAMRVCDLLTMSTGHAEDTTPAMRGPEPGTWVQKFLALPVVYPPGTHFLYNSGATYMASAIVQKLTGRTLLEYLTPRLFEPLGIRGATWEQSPEGINTGGWGLSIRTEDIARFGQMYLQKGAWDGRRVLPESWVKAATSAQVSNGSSPESDWEQGYGFQFWRCRHNAYRGDGAFGQFCLVMPDQEAVLAITSGTDDMQGVLNLVWKHLLPAMHEDSLPEDPEEQSLLTGRLAHLALSLPQGALDSPLAAQIAGRVYQMVENPTQTQRAALDFVDGEAVLRLSGTDWEEQIPVGLGEWLESPVYLFKPFATPAAVSGVWLDENCFLVQARLLETPFTVNMLLHFEDDRLTIDAEPNLALGPKQSAHLQGVALS